MKIFIIGGTNSGKSTFAKKLENYLEESNEDFYTIESSSILMKRDDVPSFTRETRTKVLTKFTNSLLKSDVGIVGKEIKKELLKNKSKIQIIVGVRNPYDFTLLFNPKSDMVFTTDSKMKNEFENSGIKSIKSYLKFLSKSNLLKHKVFEKGSFKFFNIEKYL